VNDVEANAGYLLWRLSMRWRAMVDRAVAPLGLTQAQYSLLASLYGLSQGGRRPSQRELADFTGLDAIYVSKLARALQRAGFVTRDAHTTDTRAVELSLTDQGTEVVRAAVRTVQSLQEQLTQPLGGTRGDRTREFTQMLGQLLAHVETLPPPYGPA
jgi:MarR family transcriptional regulator, organic hydroperoxide resistance regulator